MPAFLNPLLLWGLAAAAIPVVIHLLHRRRFQRQRWAAMEWLLLAAKQSKKRLQMENLLLLLARTLAVLLLALALTRPSFSEIPTLLGATRKTHLYVLLDNSASMSAKNGTRMVFDEALGAVSSQISALSDDDPVSLVMTNDVWTDERRTGRPRMILRESHDHSAVRRRLGELKPAAARADLADALRTLDEAVPSTGTIGRRVIIVSDFQAVAVLGLGDSSDRALGAASGGAQGDPVRAVLERLHAKGAEVIPIQVGREAVNIGITDLRPADDRDIVQGATAIFRAEVRNFSDRPKKIEVKFSVDGEERGESSQWVTLAARPAGGGQPASGTAQFWTVFPERDVGPHVITARIDTDAMPLDDQRSLAFNVRSQIRVLLVDGDPSPPPGRDSEVQWLRSAVGLQEENGPFSPSVMTEERFHSLTSYSAYDVIVLANVRHPAPSEDARKRLQAYVRAGGALFLTVGDRVVPSTWNDELYARGVPPAAPSAPGAPLPPPVSQELRDGGLLPVKLGVAKFDPESVLRFDLSGSRHPILADITNPANASFFESPVLNGFMTADGAESEQQSVVVLRLADLAKTPIMVEKRFGKGSVLLYLSTIDDDWGHLLGSYLFPVLVHESIHHLTSHGNADRNLDCFRPWTRAIPPNFLAMEVVKPDGTSSRVERDVSGDAANATFADTDQPGIYRAQVQLKAEDLLAQAPAPLRDVFAVNLTPLESDLARIEQDELLRRWSGLVATNEKAADATDRARAHAGEIAVPLIIGALLCLLAEIFLVQRIGIKRR